MENLLPIGSIITLTGGEKRLMICGIVQENPEDGKRYDYLAFPYPEGYVGEEHIYMFNHEEIKRVDAEGFMDEEYHVFREKLADDCRNLKLPKQLTYHKNI